MPHTVSFGDKLLAMRTFFSPLAACVLIALLFPMRPAAGAATVPSGPTAKTAARDSVPPAPQLTTTRLGDRMWRLAGVEAGGVLVLDGTDGLLIVDTQDSTTAKSLDAALAKLSRHPVRYVINTHYHQDHTAGNQRFHDRGAVVIAQANVTVQASKDTLVEALGWHRRPLPEAGLPTVTFQDSLHLHVDGEEIVLMHPPNAHTDGDAMLWFPRRNLIHTGDIVEVGAPPFIDWWAGGTLDGMIAAVDRILAMSDDQTVIVPGHGDVVNRAFVVSYRQMLVDAGTSARAAIARGQSLKDYGDSKPLIEYADRLGGERRARRLAIQTYYGLNGFKEQ
ncbi:MAG TPA: MBL fold metallo-hydrolase [Candidatus Sulfotelmatobacter sp.]|nr:MBL fold metallo-hydrolase [Candidatus Sulfotelmatobacter sp.]